MAGGDDSEVQPQVYDARKLGAAKKRRRSPSPASNGDRNRSDRHANEELPVPYDAKALEPAKKRQRSTSPGAGQSGGGEDAPRKPKRPGQRARITDAEREAIRQRALDREREREREAQHRQAAEAEQRNAVNDVVRAHYNAVPERGRDWRKTDSRIKGLRSFNNWIKSCIIQKFSPDEDFHPGAGGTGSSDLLILDIGCGKGGDLGKWQQAPQPVELYVGLDPADVSIDQARERYRSMANRGGGGRGGRGGYQNNRRPRLFEARFHVKDCFSESIGDIDIVRQVGYDSSGQGRSRGFDVVTMMFCMHYAFETEEKARTMLKNVASSLKKGGRLIGAIPSSDVISGKVVEHHERLAEKKAKKEEAKKEAKKEVAEATVPEKAAAAAEDGEVDEGEEGEVSDTAESVEWGNDIYRVRFPGKTPEDGVFRPPYGWKYNFFLHEAVEEVPEYVIPWEFLRFLAEQYNLELQYHKSFREIWESEKDDRILGPLSERMGVRDRRTGELAVTPEEMEAASFYSAFCFYKV